MRSRAGSRTPRGWRALGALLALPLLLVLACNNAPAAQPAASASRPSGAPASSAPASAAAPTSAASEAPAAVRPEPVAAAPAAEPVKLKVAYSQIWGANVVPWLAYEHGIFRKYGLDVDMSYVASSQTVPATLSGDVDIAIGGGYAVINSRLAGSDLVMFYNAMNWYPYLLMTAPEISTPAELRGKILGVSRFGSASDVATRVALKQINLVPDRDVTLIQVGSLQERIAAMKSGAIAGGVAAPPDTLILKRQGFKSIYDLQQSPDKELPNSVFATERWLNANTATAQAFVDALTEATYVTKTNREAAERVLTQYLKLEDPEEAAEAYDGFVTRMERAPDLGFEAAREYLAQQSATDPRAVGAQPAQFFDTRFMDRLKASGLVERLYGN